MSKYKVEDIRNIALCGHGACGKTTLADKLLVKTGAVSGEPSVDSGTSIGDFDPEEKAHKRTIESSEDNGENWRSLYLKVSKVKGDDQHTARVWIDAFAEPAEGAPSLTRPPWPRW